MPPRTVKEDACATRQYDGGDVARLALIAEASVLSSTIDFENPGIAQLQYLLLSSKLVVDEDIRADRLDFNGVFFASSSARAVEIKFRSSAASFFRRATEASNSRHCSSVTFVKSSAWATSFLAEEPRELGPLLALTVPALWTIM